MKFDYGQSVQIFETAPAKFLEFGSVGSVCGVDQIETQKRSAEFDAPIGTPVYLIEAPCGNAIEVPEIHLALL
jgi:hypothetical protein